jgi:hypothetical protein
VGGQKAKIEVVRKKKGRLKERRMLVNLGNCLSQAEDDCLW